ncbi:transferase, Chloramphenicol acetyltransferase-like domain protein [Artemisia annua]|uniref:Transferase, Chloramphenicol acetyltransferase-like domain protein n=1 Tax=Artemisia annua TaxID=35608 RepID=A0A2U1K901_ARTAN|nr:transferase, Chloramphenicol acetyltransferase-like domain protein [Artemisia annua]
MTSSTINYVFECFIKPQHNLPTHSDQPIHLTPSELLILNVGYTQNGLLFSKPENQDFSMALLLNDLKHTLSATLTHFYPLAARLATQKQENPPSYVICIDPKNSPGAKFIYATSEAIVNDILTPSYVPSLVHSLFDLNDAINHDGHTLPLLSIQVTELIDGVFIGMSLNHVVTDGATFWHFMATWSELFKSKKGDVKLISRPPIYERCNPIINLPFTHHEQFTERLRPTNSIKERFFHFTSDSVSRLKAKANAECNTTKISSLQAVSALLWRCITRARRLPHDSKTVCGLAINNRHRVDPPLSNNYFGNPIQIVRHTTTVNDLMTHGLGWAALGLHDVVKNHNHTTIKDWVESWVKNPMILKRNLFVNPGAVQVSNSPRFDMYGCEFGLGKAVCVRSGSTNKMDGKVIMYPGREGGGSMDVEVCLLPEYMAEFECDEELTSALKIT